MASQIPVGTVIPYAGGQLSRLQSEGWLPCKGQRLNPSTYRELFEVIGTVNGGDGNTSFLLPNLQGLFVRGVDDGSGHDPDAATRVAAANGGQSGDAVGSLQFYATKLPNEDFEAAVPHLPTSDTKGNYGSLVGDDYADWKGGSVTVTVDGGDVETRPVNAYVYFIIKYKHVEAHPGVPIGALVALAGENVTALEGEYILCDGSKLSTESERHALLYDAIGTSSGGDGLPYFFLPDYRGRFLRGVAGASSYDPDKDSRTAAVAGGNVGNNIGSVQDFATGKPHTPFKTSISHLPDGHDKIDHIAGRDCSKWNGGDETVDLASSGGDAESRPVNVYVNWFIKAYDLPNEQPLAASR